MKELTSKLVLLIIGLTAGSGILIPTTYASFHPVTSSEIADGTIQSIDIGTGQVKNVDVGAGAISSAKIAAGAVQNSDIATNAVDSAKIKDGAIVEADLAQGLIDRISSLEDRLNNLKIHTRLEEVTLPVPANSFRSFFIECSDDETLLGGGYSQADRAKNYIWESEERNSDGNNAYLLGYWNLEDEEVTLRANALCGKIVS